MSKNLEVVYLMDFYGDVLTEKQRAVMEEYYNDDLSLAEIAQNHGISRQGVRDAIKRGESILKRMEDKVGFVARTRRIQASLEELERLAKDIAFRNSGSYGTSSEEINRSVAGMLRILQTLAE